MTLYRIFGLEKFRRFLSRMRGDLQGTPFEASMERATMVVLRASKQNAPVDTGALRGSLEGEVRRTGLLGNTVMGVVGSNLHYSPYMEYGTAGGYSYYPPPGALAGWASRHGYTDWGIRAAINARGTSMMALSKVGTRGYRYLQRAVEDNEKRITELIGNFVARIIIR